MTLAELWNIYVQFMWDEKYILGLEQFLKSHKIKTILDCAGGVGFPAIALKKKRWDIVYADRSKEMFDFFEKKLQEEKINIPFYFVNWLELSKKLDRKFDAVLCRGNSLVYVDSWGENNIQKATKENIKKSLLEFWKVLNPGGLLYIDIINKEEFDRTSYPIVEDYGEKVIDGRKVRLRWEMSHDYTTHMRTWKAIVSVDEARYEFLYSSYLLRHEELVNMLNEIGFKNVQEVKIGGENNYNVFVAFR